MSIRHLLPIFSLFLFPILTQAQDYRVTGQVKGDMSGDPLESTTVVLLTPGDSSLVTGATTDSLGNFTIDASRGDYILKIRYIGYQSLHFPNVSLTAEDPVHNVGTVHLKPAASKTGEVRIEGERSRLTMEEGKKVFNVGSDLSMSGASAADVLNNIPSVSTDMEGNISLRGSQGVRILVNGRPSSMMGLSGAEALRYFPANQIKEVEVITNPSAKYEAQGAAGIINIILKENIDWGLNGTFTVEAGWPHNHGASVNMNYRDKWFNIFGSYNFSYDRAPGGGWREQTFNYPDTTYSLRIDDDQSRGGINHDFQVGSDLYFTPNDVLQVSGVYSVGDQRNYTDLVFYDYSGARIAEEDLVGRSKRDELEKEKEGDKELNISYEKTFGEEDHELTALLQARNSVEIEDASLVETEGFPRNNVDTVLFQNSLNNTDVTAYMGKLDYTWPFSDSGKFMTGIRAERRGIKNIFKVEQRPDNSASWNTLDEFSNTFFYTEEIYGVYAMYNNEIGDFGYQAGLRYEYTGIGTRLESQENVSERSYSNFFPSLSLSYSISDTASLQVSYSRRLDRPYFRELNPYNTFNNNRVYNTGNPTLDPEFTGAYDLGYVYYTPKGSFYFGGFYRRTKNEIENVDTINANGVTVVKPYNLDSRDNIGVEARYSRALTEWWDISLTTNIFHSSTSGSVAGEDLNNAAITMDGQVRMDFDVKDWFRFQTNAEYRAPESEGQDYEQAMYEINAGIQKELFDGKGNVAFSVRDMFNTDIYRARTDGSNFNARRQHQWRIGPFWSLSFTYELKDKDARADKETMFGEGDR